MAKSKLSWSLDGSKMTVEVLEIKKKLTFDLAEIFPDFVKLKDVQQKMIANGAKQKLADSLARSADVTLTAQEMVTELQALWARLVAGNWNRPGGEAKATMKKKLEEAKEKATPAELAVLKKLGLA